MEYSENLVAILEKFGLAILLSGVIGLERQRKARGAGLRTHILVCLGSTMLMVLSEYLGHEDAAIAWVDGGRIAIGAMGVGIAQACLDAALKYLGYSVNSKNPAEIQAAANLLIEQKQKGIVKAYQVDETKDKMVAGEAALAVVWSGDAQYAINLNEDLAYVVPKEGSNVWVDSMVIPRSAPNPENAHIFINFMSRPDIAQMNAEYIEYSSPNAGAIELMGEDYTGNPTLNPSRETIGNCEFFHDNNDVKVLYDTYWGMVKNAK